MKYEVGGSLHQSYNGRWFDPNEPTQNQEVTTSKIVTFFGASPEADWRNQSGQDADR
jgi:hypothetical protein